MHQSVMSTRLCFSRLISVLFYQHRWWPQCICHCLSFCYQMDAMHPLTFTVHLTDIIFIFSFKLFIYYYVYTCVLWMFIFIVYTLACVLQSLSSHDEPAWITTRLWKKKSAAKYHGCGKTELFNPHFFNGVGRTCR